VPKWKAYRNKPLAEHITDANTLKQDGYRPLSICLHTPDFGPADDSDVCYSAIWVKRAGPDWDMLPLGDEGDLNAFVAAAKSKPAPLWPRLITASGVGYPRFSVVVEQGGAESYVDVGVFGFFVDDELEAKRKGGEFPRSVAVYGTDVNAMEGYQCAFVWEKQPANATLYYHGFSVAEADVTTINAALEAGFSRVDYALPYTNHQVQGGSITTGRRYFLIYRNDRIPGTVLKTNLSSGEVYDTIEKGKKKDKWPIRLHGVGLPGPEQRFGLVLADYPHDREPARVWTVMRPTYPRAAGPNPSKTFSALEQAFKQAMTRNSVHAGQLAVAYQGRLVYTAGFTWAPPGYPITSPTVRFPVGSISKTITALAVCQLWDQGKLYPLAYSPQNSVAALLKRSFKDKRFKKRHCGQLLSHLGRFDQDKILAETDPWKVSSDLGVPMPIMMDDVVDWIAQHMDDAFLEEKAPEPGGTPLPKAKYCGVGFTMMAQICAEFYAEKGYANLEEGVRGELFARVGVSRPRKFTVKVKTAYDGAMKGQEVLRHPSRPTWWYSQQGDGEPAPVTYDASNSNVFLGNGAWTMSCADYARVLSAFDEHPNPLFDNQVMPYLILTEQAEGWYRGFVKRTFATAAGGTVDAMWHNGMFPGCAAVGFRRYDGVVVVYAWNTDIIGMGFPDTDANAAVNEVTTWPSYDLFPTVGIG
jgi:hypothetical protein